MEGGGEPTASGTLALKASMCRHHGVFFTFEEKTIHEPREYKNSLPVDVSLVCGRLQFPNILGMTNFGGPSSCKSLLCRLCKRRSPL